MLTAREIDQAARDIAFEAQLAAMQGHDWRSHVEAALTQFADRVRNAIRQAVLGKVALR